MDSIKIYAIVGIFKMNPLALFTSKMQDSINARKVNEKQ